MTGIRFTLLGFFALSAGAVAEAAGPGPVAQIFVDPPLPLCQDRLVLDRIADRFAWAQRNTWRTELIILRYEAIAETPAAGRRSALERRFCRAEVTLRNGDREPLYYFIEYPGGFGGTYWNVVFCLPGYDRWQVYGAACASVRP